jgi:hypothetical protein
MIYFFCNDAENNSPKYFIYYSHTIDEKKLNLECFQLFPFFKNNSPMKLIDTIWACDKFDVDKYVKLYMNNYGIENVRGGSYSNEILTDENLQAINHELTYMNDNYETEMVNFIHNIHNIHNENGVYEVLQKQYTKYCFLKKKINFYSTFFEKEKEFEKKNEFEKIKYLKNILKEIIQNINMLKENPNLIKFKTYQNLLSIFKSITKIEELQTIKMPFPYEPVYLQNPEFILDDYMLGETDEIGETICEIFEGMVCHILNRITEFEFDLQFYPKYFDDKYRILLENTTQH